ncbi:helix-turn-helix domain-containing protein [Phytopseudomonas dryadis]|uniref:Transcriptional regulator n=1 Tax=Phytopseudomonas dryadis TaxID=2487520 RepID=A0A4Q9QNX5_9GAMM|nr:MULTISPECIES: helix-turn-helix transcriptional regulator [Pseudomonas]TBU81903.1 transcriptional regulator [Pseudomonas dryadis]TBV08476.1 transcriptional regulator [Pseudomonas dryadis]TBV18845.1 transcriptional regulator [Pseudomonas sp. FRB 230]
MSFTERFLQLRKQNGLTQQQMAETVGIHITQVKRYEAGETQPSLEVLKKVAVAFGVTTDWLIFEEGEREPQDELKLKFEAVTHMDEEERRSILVVLDAMILRYQTKRSPPKSAAPTN